MVYDGIKAELDTYGVGDAAFPAFTRHQPRARRFCGANEPHSDNPCSTSIS